MSDEAALLEEARRLAWVRPLGPYPGWRFNIDWDRPEPDFRRRREIWTIFHERQRQVPLTINWYGRLRVNLYLGNDLSRPLFVGGCIDPNEFAFLDGLLRSGMTFLDVGSNDGLYALFASERVGPSGQVWAFEPSPREFERLSRNLELNRTRNIRTFPLALGSHTGEADLLIAGYGHEGQNTLGAFIYPGVENAEKVRVSVRKLDDLIAGQGLARLDVLKVDVEGAEVSVLQGAGRVLQSMRPVLLFELSDAALRNQGSSAGELLALLRGFDYRIYGFDATTGRPAPEQGLDASLNRIAAPSERPLV